MEQNGHDRPTPSFGGCSPHHDLVTGAKSDLLQISGPIQPWESPGNRRREPAGMRNWEACSGSGRWPHLLALSAAPPAICLPLRSRKREPCRSLSCISAPPRVFLFTTKAFTFADRLRPVKSLYIPGLSVHCFLSPLFATDFGLCIPLHIHTTFRRGSALGPRELAQAPRAINPQGSPTHHITAEPAAFFFPSSSPRFLIFFKHQTTTNTPHHPRHHPSTSLFRSIARQLQR